ncbi:MAG: LON peptidase substrate-binding domain-containing protein [Flavobacteriales bacterium]|nr:LON peptidase substrate-binding domain-containing protein [Flavobacteriales bacterium]
MTTFLPAFPLEIVVFPNETLNLHIFEERYKQLVNECYNTQKPFVIPSVIQGKVSEYGTEVEISRIDKIYPDGRMDIRTLGIQVVRILEFIPQVENKLYPAAIVTYNHPYSKLLESDIASDDTVKKLKELLVHLAEVLRISKNLIPSSDRFIAYRIAHYLGMPLEDEYRLLLTLSETERQHQLIEFIQKVLPSIEQRELMREKIHLNGHFKHLKPPNF